MHIRSFSLGVALWAGCGQPTPAPSAPASATQAAPAPALAEGKPPEIPSASSAQTLGGSPAEGAAASPSASSPRGLVELAVAGFLPALVSWPEADRWPQPVLVAAHGAGDSAESQCELWRQLLDERGVVVCLRGRAMRKGSSRHGYYFPDHLTLERELLASLDSLARRHPEHADPRRITYAGYSQGAQMGLLMLLDRGALAPRLLLVEGGSGDWTEASVARFAESGGERVALVCGTPGCRANAQRSAELLRARGLQASLRHVPGGGHTYLGAVAPECGRALAELIQGDPRWQP